METENKIGTGAQAEVFLSEDYAIKVFRQGYEKAAIFYEAAVTSLIELTGLPIAKVREVIDIQNRLAIKLDYISGKSLNNCMLEDRVNSFQYIKQMVNIQLNIFSKTLSLPFSLKQTLKNKIEGNASIPEPVKKNLRLRLAELQEGLQLCHGDFHGDNIIMQGDKPFIIDWVDATSGHPDGDVCRTYMLNSFYHSEIADKYLDCYCAIAKKEKCAVLKWLPVVAAASLTDNNENEKEKIQNWIETML